MGERTRVDDASGGERDLGLVGRIDSRYEDLRKSERVVADYLRRHSGQRLDTSITELARRLGVSEATVSRVSRALGYAGFVDMKLALAAGASERGRFANLPIDFDAHDNAATIGRKLASALSASLEETYRSLDAGALDRALEAIVTARKIVFLGVGGAGAVCAEAAHMFLKAGADVASYSDGYTQTIVSVAAGGAERVFVGVSHTGETQVVADALATAREAGSPTIAITSDPETPVARAAETTLVTWQHGGGQIPLYGDFLEGRICQLYLINVLYLGYLFQRGGAAQAQLEATMEALRRHNV